MVCAWCKKRKVSPGDTLCKPCRDIVDELDDKQASQFDDYAVLHGSEQREAIRQQPRRKWGKDWQ